MCTHPPKQINRSSLTWLILLFGLLSLTCASGSIASTVNNEVSETWLVQTSEKLNQDSQLNAEEKQDLNAKVEQAKTWLTASKNYQQTLQTLKASEAQIPKRLADIKQRRAQLKEETTKTQTPTKHAATESTLKSQLNQAELELNEANRQFLTWNSTLNQYLKLATNGANQKSELENGLTPQPLSIEGLDKQTTTNLVLEIEQAYLQTRQAVIRGGLALLDYKLDNLNQLTEWAQAEHDLWREQQTYWQNQVALYQTKLQTVKANEARLALKQTIDEQIDKNSPLFPLYTLIIEVQKEKAELIHLEKRVDQEMGAVKAKMTVLKADFSRDQQIIDLEGSQEIIAQILHKRLASLSALLPRSNKASAIKDQLNEAILKQLLLSEKLREYTTLTREQRVNAIRDMLPDSISETDEKRILEQAETFNEKYLDAAKTLQILYPNYISKLSELSAQQTQLQTQTKAYLSFLNNHLLWLPNVDFYDYFSSVAYSQDVTFFFSEQNISAFFEDVLTLIQTETAKIVFWLLLLGGLFMARNRAKRSLKRLSLLVSTPRTDSVVYTLLALGYTLILVAFIPWGLVGAAYLLNTLSAPSDFTLGLTKGLIDAGLYLLILGALQQVCRENGLATQHFHWHTETRKSLLKELNWVMPLGALLILFIDINSMSSSPQQLVGRIALLALMIGFAVLIYRLWSKNSPIIKACSNQPKNNKWLQLHFLWFPLLLAVPLFIIFSTLSGYYYSALVMAERLNWTLGLGLAVYLIRALFLRGLYSADRKQHYLEMLDKHQALMAKQHGPLDKTDAADEPFTAPSEEFEIDYDKLNKQARQALNLGYILLFLSGLWLLWSDILPALNLISDSNLDLTKSQLIDGVQQQIPLTLGDLIIGLGLGAITLLVAKDLPGLLEFMLLKHLPISNAARYATASLTQYVVAIIGFVMIFRALGIEWSNIQWLVAALSVGLGFGLQEIVANFVSGIILLFEQPMRVGDTVTVNGVSGKVSKIRIRATTIVNWDRQELLIPNKQIITGEFINWSLSDQVIRVRIEVGIAYGSDVDEALRIIKKVADESGLLLKDPEPFVLFESFGDSALILSLRGYLDDLDNLLKIKSALNLEINKQLEKAGIVIAFPQRDIHLDTSEPLEIKLSKSKAVPKEDAEIQA